MTPYEYCNKYIEYLFFLSYFEECSAAASTVPDIILPLVEYDLGVESGNELVRYCDFIAAISAHHPSLILKRVTICLGNFALFNN